MDLCWTTALLVGDEGIFFIVSKNCYCAKLGISQL